MAVFSKLSKSVSPFVSAVVIIFLFLLTTKCCFYLFISNCTYFLIPFVNSLARVTWNLPLVCVHLSYVNLDFKAVPTRSNTLQKLNIFIITIKPPSHTWYQSVASGLFDRAASLLLCTAKFSWFSAYAPLLVGSTRFPLSVWNHYLGTEREGNL